MRTTTARPSPKRRANSGSPSKQSRYPQLPPHLQQHSALNPAAIQALMYAQQQQQQQQQQGWIGVDNNMPLAYAPGPLVHAAIPTMGYPGVPRMMAPNQFHVQQALAMQQAQLVHQAQLAQQVYAQPQPQILQLVHPPMDIDPIKDNFVYVQDEVREEVDSKVMEAIKKRALFVAPPLGRIRIPQACERCRKRKTKCTGEKPQCKRCQKRGYECEYVMEHRANKTKKALAEREEAARLAEEEATVNGQIPVMYDDPSAMPMCPTAGPAWSNSSGYSAASASSLPPPHLYAGQSLYAHAVPAYSSAPGYSTNSLASALGTPAIMIEGRPLVSSSSNMRLQAPPAPIASRSRSNSRAKRPTPANRPTPSHSVNDLQAVSRSTSTMSMQQSDMPLPAASPSCQACLSEMSNCNACEMEKQSMQPHQHYTEVHGNHTTPITVDSPVCGPFPPSPPPQVKQHLLNAVNRALAKQAGDRARAAGVSPEDNGAMPVPPMLFRDGSSSSSGSDGQSHSGLQTPHDYFTYPGGSGTYGGQSTLSPAGYGNADQGMVKTSESMVEANAYQGMYGSSPGEMCQSQEPAHNGEGGMQFSDYFHSFEPATSDSMHSIYDSEY